MSAGAVWDLDDDALLALRARYLEQRRIVDGGAVLSLEPGDTLDRAGIARVMLELDRRMSQLARLAAQLRACPEGDGIMAAKRCDEAGRLLRSEFEQGATLLGVFLSTTREEMRALVAELERARRADDERS